MKVPVSKINVIDRIREVDDLKLRDLADSMKRLGQLQPIAVDKSYQLIDGARRLRVCELQGWDVEVAVIATIDDAIKHAEAERDANECALPFTTSERVAMGKRLEVLEREAAKGRQRQAGGDRGNQHTGGKSGASEKITEAPTGTTRDKVGAAIGMSGPTYQRAKAVVDAAAQPDAPAEVKEAAAEMDRTGNVSRAYKTVTGSDPREKSTRPGKPCNAVSSKPEGELQGKGVILANEAINCLTRIPKNDPLRQRGMQIVADWIRRNK
jgi:hypothetical protein